MATTAPARWPARFQGPDRSDYDRTREPAGRRRMGSELRTLERADLEQLLAALSGAGYELIGPTVRQGAIAFERIGSVADLPIGLARRPGRRHLPARAAATTRRVRVRNGPAVLEAPAAPAGAEPVEGAPVGRRRDRVRRGRRRGPDARLHRRPLLRPARDRHPRSRPCWRSAPDRPTTRHAARASSSSRSTARRRAAPASASRWIPGRGRARASTSR